MSQIIKIMTVMAFGCLALACGQTAQIELEKPTSNQNPPPGAPEPLTWDKSAAKQLGHFLASLVTLNHQVTIHEAFEPGQLYSSQDCRMSMKSFINRSQSSGYQIAWGLHESFILVRAFSPESPGNRLDIKHFALWHSRDPRFWQLPSELTQESCTYYNQPFVATVF